MLLLEDAYEELWASSALQHLVLQLIRTAIAAATVVDSCLRRRRRSLAAAMVRGGERVKYIESTVEYIQSPARHFS